MKSFVMAPSNSDPLSCGWHIIWICLISPWCSWRRLGDCTTRLYTVIYQICFFFQKYIPFYSQLSSVTLALDLLLKNERYEDVVNLFNFAIENYKFDYKYPSDFVTVYLVACYKLVCTTFHVFLFVAFICLFLIYCRTHWLHLTKRTACFVR